MARCQKNLGQDVTKPLPNERPLVESIADAGREDLREVVDSSGMDINEAELLKKDTYQASDVEADQVLSNEILDDELMAQIAMLGDGGEIEFGQSDDEEHTMETVKGDVLAPAPASEDTEASYAASQSTSLTAVSGPENQNDDGLVGPFHSPGERAGYLIGTMKDAVVKWFTENKVAIIAGIIAGIAGLILVNVLTGGAIMAALPLLMQIIGALFAAEGIYQMARYFGQYLGAAWPGNLGEGAAKLARGLAALTIELVFALLFGGKAALKGAKTAVKTVAKQGVKGAMKTGVKAAKAGAKKAIKETAKAAKDLAKVTKNGAKAALKNGKVAMKGVRKGFAKGAKNFDDLGKRLSKKLRFKKFKIEVKKRRWRLLGEINPWVLLANGEIKEVNIKKGDEIGSHGKFKLTDGSGDVEGYLIGKRNRPNKSNYVQSVEEMDVESRLKELDELELNGKSHIQGYDSFDYEKAIQELGKDSADAIKNRSRLCTALGKSPGPGFNAHHIIPVDLIAKSKALRIAIKNGFEFNGKINGKWLKRFSSQVKKNKAGDIIADIGGTHASHPKYNEEVLKRLSTINISQDPQKILLEVKKIVKDLDDELTENPAILLNELFK